MTQNSWQTDCHYRIDGHLDIIESLNDEINTVSKKILLLAQKDEMARLLMTVPGIGYYSALLIVSEIGDLNRFPDSYHLCSLSSSDRLTLLFATRKENLRLTHLAEKISATVQETSRHLGRLTDAKLIETSKALVFRQSTRFDPK